MAKINLNDAFLTTKVKNDTEIERATTKNINRISQTDIQEIHQNLMRVLNIKSESESKYFTFENFKALVVKLKHDKKINDEYKNYKLQTGEKALSKSDWLNQKSKNVTSPVSNEYSAPTTISLPFSINCSSTAEP